MSNSDRFNRLLATVAKQLDLPEDSDTAQRLALLKFAREQLAVRLIDNVERIDTGELLELDKAIVAMTPPTSSSHEVVITLVGPKDAAKPGDGSIGGLAACRRCGWSPPAGDVVQRCYRCGIGPHGDHGRNDTRNHQPSRSA